MSDFYIKQGDTLPVLRVTLYESDGVPIVNTNVDAIEFRFRRPNGSLLTRTPSDSGAGGIYTYAFQAADWLPGQFSPGRYRLDAVLTIGVDRVTIPTRTPKIAEVVKAA